MDDHATAASQPGGSGRMLVKFETKSNRVKGVAFHPRRPWVIASLHTGVIQLWDYRVAVLLDRFDEHEGPVRTVSFHATQPLFVSGGDDYKVKVWNYKQRRCLFTLTGHQDYIRTVAFHHEYPWIISASDDQTIRIWNWQSRTCIAVLTGHNHYVMSAEFHPKEDLIVSASLDQTVRVWDISGLRRKAMPGMGATPRPGSDEPTKPLLQNDLFGSVDAYVKFVLEDHDRGVNWASFHPELSLIVSGADDRQVKIWRYTDTKAWHVDSCRGHYSHATCVIFHPRQDLILSASEDKTLRVWDITKRTAVATFRREHDRFWIIKAHPTENLFVTGHDAGLIVFKLERERPASTVHGSNLLYVKDKHLRVVDMRSGANNLLANIRRYTSPGGGISFGTQPRSMTYNEAENAVLLYSKAEGGSYELIHLGEPGRAGKDLESQTVLRGAGLSAVFVARNRFAVLDKSHQLFVKNMNNELVRQYKVPANADQIFFTGSSQVMLRSDDSVAILDLQHPGGRIAHELAVANVKYVIWSQDMQFAALISRHTVTLVNRRLEQLASIHETIRVKSGVWSSENVFIYTTVNHIKYSLSNGDNGIICSIASPIYLCKIDTAYGTSATGPTVAGASAVLHCLDRRGEHTTMRIDPAEYLFKLALVERRYDRVLEMIRSSNLIGQSIIAYLQKKGFAEIALHFVRDEVTRFNLALECGNLPLAREMAVLLDRGDTWLKLADEAIMMGNVRIAESALRRSRTAAHPSTAAALSAGQDRLTLLNLITGEHQKLTAVPDNPMLSYNNALFTGNVEEQVRALRDSGQLPLAYMTAKSRGLDALAEEILLSSGLVPPAADPETGAPVPVTTMTPELHQHLAGILSPALAHPAPVAKTLEVAPQPLVDLEDPNWPVSADAGPEGGSFPAAPAATSTASAPVSAGLDFDFDEPKHPGTGGSASIGAAPPTYPGEDVSFGGLDQATSGTAAGTTTGAPGGGAATTVAAPSGDWLSDDGLDDLGLDDDLGLEDAMGGGDIGGPAGARVGGGPGAPPASELLLEAPLPAVAVTDAWLGAPFAAFHIAAGSFDTAMALLRDRFGITDFQPLRPLFRTIYQASYFQVPTIPGYPALVAPLHDLHSGGDHGPAAPLQLAAFSVAGLNRQVNDTLELVTAGHFGRALDDFRGILHAALFMTPHSLADRAAGLADFSLVDAAQARTIALCQAYILALSIELTRKALDAALEDRRAELAVHFVYAGGCYMLANHMALGLNSAMLSTFRAKCFGTCSQIASVLLSPMFPNLAPAHEATAQKVLAAARQKGNRNLVKIEVAVPGAPGTPLPTEAPVPLCAADFVLLPPSAKPASCPLCRSQYNPQHAGTTCRVCQLAQIL